MPIPGTGVFHPKWSGHHRQTATSTMTADCTITRRGGAGTTGATGTWTPAAAQAVYTGPCRVQEIGITERLLVIGEGQETHRRYQVSILHDAAEVKVSDVIEVTASVDKGLPGKKLRVVDVRYGSEQWQQDLVCDELEV